MKKTIFLFCFCAVQLLQAQQTPLFSVYRDQWSILNPAAISNNFLLNNRSMTLSGTWHTQWWGLPESPRTQLLNWEYVADEKNSVFGAHVLNDQTGKIGQTGVYGRFAYRIKSGKRVVQSFTIGLSAGAVQYRARLSEIRFPDPSTQPLGDDRAIRPDIGVGIFYQYSNRYYAGLSVPQTFGLNTDFDAGKEDFTIRRIPHVYAVAGGYWSAPWLGNETSFIEPSVWIKYAPNSPLNVDANLRCQINELLWAGTGLNAGLGDQFSAALHFEAGLFFGEQVQMLNSQLKVGFGFDLPVTQSLATTFGAGGEVNLVYAFK
ncbi:MAG TPA: PorP/SprF family type IX secretion system membrane protein [Saprospiraceae bacterium]|nr:PorP/SprF family type IX secretion system membrane protein [Saprospiraceae bacterium]HPI07921.1 PorP/SprF family type IX secretion system membrane protein [Saprospiraceae bacterium]